jgi:hypothetical protein
MHRLRARGVLFGECSCCIGRPNPLTGSAHRAFIFKSEHTEVVDALRKVRFDDDVAGDHTAANGPHPSTKLQADLIVNYCEQANALIEPFKSISVLGKWPNNRLLGQVIAAN